MSYMHLDFIFKFINWMGRRGGRCWGWRYHYHHEQRKRVRVRLYGIDCPEQKQDFGQKAKRFTSNLVFGKIVVVNRFDTDQYGRTVGKVIIGSQCTNEELIKAGLAWVYTRHCKQPFCVKWKNLEKEACKNKVGLWSMPTPTPPWEFRYREQLDLMFPNEPGQPINYRIRPSDTLSRL